MQPKPFFMEFFGTALLTSAIIGAGYMASGTTQDAGLGLLINACAAAAMLSIIIRMGARISGAHYNPAVTLAMLLSKKISPLMAFNYLFTQILGAIAGAVLGNAMYGADLIHKSGMERINNVLIISEIVATAGLVWVVLRFAHKVQAVATFAPLWIFSAYFFTSSSTFANPAVTIGRVFTQSPAGISPASLSRFIGAQFIGACLGWLIHTYITEKEVVAAVADSGENAEPVI